ncbi:MAG: preprotein translocase subunit SecG [Clostridiales bacterium]|nr:preprotein translocase subunit SecG [Clostridiales bacterium]
MNVLVGLLLIIHIVASLALVLLILLHSGKGTGVSSMFSGVMPATATGTGIIEKNLDRLTIAAAVTFTVTTLLLMVTYTPGG